MKKSKEIELLSRYKACCEECPDNGVLCDECMCQLVIDAVERGWFLMKAIQNYSYPAEIGFVIKKARQDRGLSQKYVAEKIGVTAQVYSRYENGHRNPNTMIVSRIADVLDLSFFELTTGIRLKEEPWHKEYVLIPR